MRTRKYGILGLMLGATLLATACDDETTAPPPAVTVTVSPDPVPPLDIGQTVQMVAVVANSTNQQVTWTSSTPAVASVSATGLVTALTQGVTVITATSAADPNARDAVTIQVNPPAAPPTVSIKSVTQGGLNTPVNPNNIQGQIDVTLNVEVPQGAQVERVETLIDGNVVCSQGFSGGSDIAAGDEANAPQVEIVCSINTAEFNAATGVPRFTNGPHTLTARLVQPGGNIIATPSTALIFNNPDRLNMTVAASCTGATCPQTDPTGLAWHTGDLTVTLVPTLYSTGAAATLQQATINLRDAATNALITSRQITAAPFSFTFLKANATNAATPGVAGVENPLIIEANSIVAGQPGPTGTLGTTAAPAIRLDNDAPDTEAPDPAAAFINPPSNWYGAATPLTSDDRVANFATLDDEGVNKNTVSFQFQAVGTTTWTTFDSTDDLPQSTTTNTFLVRAVVCDALNNCTNVTAVTATGADVSPPTMTAGASRDSIFESAADLTAGNEFSLSNVVDNLSGVPANFVKVTIVRTTWTGTAVQTRCIDAAGAATAVPTAGCPGFFQAATAINIPPAAGLGYYEITAEVIDNAGNLSAEVVRVFLYDDQAPVPSVTTTTLNPTDLQVSGTVTDNLDLRGWDVRLGFGASTLPFSALTSDGTFGLPMTNSVTASGTAPRVRALSAAGGWAVAGTPLDQVGFGAVDVANNFAFDGENATGAGTADGIDNAGVINSFNAPTSSEPLLCRSGGAPCTTAEQAKTSATITAKINTDPNTDNPISVVYFYVSVPASNGGVYPLLIGSDNSGELTVNAPANDRDWTYTINLPVSMLPAISATGPTVSPYVANVFAVAVDAELDAVRTNPTAITVK